MKKFWLVFFNFDRSPFKNSEYPIIADSVSPFTNANYVWQSVLFYSNLFMSLTIISAFWTKRFPNWNENASWNILILLSFRCLYMTFSSKETFSVLLQKDNNFTEVATSRGNGGISKQSSSQIEKSDKGSIYYDGEEKGNNSFIKFVKIEH